MKTVPKPTTPAGWREIQENFIGSGSAACLINRHRHLTILDYAVRKITKQEKPPTRAMRRGLTLEDAAANLWMEEHGIAVVPATVLYTRGPFVASVDYEPVDFDASWFLEVKTNFREYIDEPLDTWSIQCIVQAWCAGRDGVHLAVLDKSGYVKSFYIDATTDEARFLMLTLEEAGARFLEVVGQGKVPEGLDLNENAVKALYPRAENKAVEIDAEALRWVSELADSRELRITAEKREKAAKDALAAILVDASSARYGDSEVLTWRNAKEGLAFNRDLFEAEHPGVLDLMADDRYRRAVPGTRTMRVTKAGLMESETAPWADQDAVW